MGFDGGIAALWRRMTSRIRPADRARDLDRGAGIRPLSGNEAFVANLDEAQRRAVLGAIFAARRPISAPAAVD